MPLACHGKLETAWDGLNEDVLLQDTGFLDLAFSACDERVDDGFIPSCMYNGDP